MKISYEKMNSVLKSKRMTMADLRKLTDIAPNTMTKIRKNESVSLEVLGRICDVLDVDFGDIIEYIHDNDEQETIDYE